jgi:c-di-GMP-binding flagellar brake protein YcgR
VFGLSSGAVFIITDISAGGVSVRCNGKSDLPTKWSLDILVTDTDFHATIPVKLVWEKTVHVSPYSSIATKYIGVQFDNLTQEHKSKVERLIKLHQ